MQSPLLQTSRRRLMEMTTAAFTSTVLAQWPDRDPFNEIDDQYAVA